MFSHLNLLYEFSRNDGTSNEHLHFDDQSKQVVFFSSTRNFQKEVEKHILRVYIEFSYKSTRVLSLYSASRVASTYIKVAEHSF